jgi:hypothetical protein
MTADEPSQPAELDSLLQARDELLGAPRGYTLLDELDEVSPHGERVGERGGRLGQPRIRGVTRNSTGGRGALSFTKST